ncbi:hypothetical protein, partial [Sphingomonas sanguinis]|uniref:hypothetical protein n=1 Tax=Sphingomonas sanguinis TaxID=33051 RepID=UPI001C3F317F
MRSNRLIGRVTLLLRPQTSDPLSKPMRQSRFKVPQLPGGTGVASLGRTPKPMAITHHIVAVETADGHIIRRARIAFSPSPPIQACGTERIGG